MPYTECQTQLPCLDPAHINTPRNAGEDGPSTCGSATHVKGIVEFFSFWPCTEPVQAEAAHLLSEAAARRTSSRLLFLSFTLPFK